MIRYFIGVVEIKDDKYILSKKILPSPMLMLNLQHSHLKSINSDANQLIKLKSIKSSNHLPKAEFYPDKSQSIFMYEIGMTFGENSKPILGSFGTSTCVIVAGKKKKLY